MPILVRGFLYYENYRNQLLNYIDYIDISAKVISIFMYNAIK